MPFQDAAFSNKRQQSWSLSFPTISSITKIGARTNFNWKLRLVYNKIWKEQAPQRSTSVKTLQALEIVCMMKAKHPVRP